MADIKISELTAALTVSDADVLPMTASGSTVKVTTALLKEHAIGNTDISGIGDGTATGAIDSLNSKDATIKAMIAPTETSPTTSGWTTGAQFIYNDVLYDVIADITAGDALTVGTNIAPADTIVEQVEDAVADIAQNASDITTLDASKMSYAANNALGAHNLFPYISTWATSNNGGTFTYSDGTYTITTSTTAYSGMFIRQDYMRPYFGQYYKSGTSLVLSFEYKGDSSFTCVIGENAHRETQISSSFQKYTATIPDITAIENIQFYSTDGVSHTITVKNIMLTVPADKDPTYAPYAMTNRELTKVGNSFEEVYSDSLISNGTIYGTVKVLKNAILPIAFLVWQGNATAIPAGDYDLVSFTGKAYKAISDSIFPVVVFVDGAWDYIRIQPNKAILHIQGVSPTWSTASCMYLTV